MAKKTGPYVGVVGFRSRDEVGQALKWVPPNDQRRLMIGVIANTWPIADIFMEDDRVLNLIHFTTTSSKPLSDQLAHTTDIGGPNLDGIQINMPWPFVRELHYHRRRHPNHYMVLQIGKEALEQIDRSPDKLKDRLSLYAPYIDAVLLDMDPRMGSYGALIYGYLEAANSIHGLQAGIAGGLGPWSLYMLDKLIADYTNLSIQAHELVLNRSNKLDHEEMRIYLEDAFVKLDGQELPGIQMRAVMPSYDLNEHYRRHGTGDNMLRTNYCAQPSALCIGDRLVTGETVVSKPRDGGNGGVWIQLQRKPHEKSDWIKVAARIPIALAQQ